MSNKIKLFQTAKKICERGEVKLSTSDKRRIENETRELLSKSLAYRSASGSSADFRKVLVKLRTSKSAAEMFKVVAQHLDDEGVLDKDVKIEDILEAVEEAVEEVLVEDKSEDTPKKDTKKEEPKVTEKDDDEDDDDKEDDGDEDESDGTPPQFLSDTDKAKEAVVRLAQEFDKGKDTPPMEDGPSKGPGKGPEKGLDKKKPTKLKDLDKKDKAEEKVTEDEMGIEKGSVGKGIAAKAKVTITADKNIVASYVGKGPLFLAVPNDDIKKDAKKLRRAANKVLGLVIYEGPKKAAAKCGARLMVADTTSGVDDDILTDSTMEVSPNSDAVTDGGEGDMITDRQTEPSTALEDSDTDTAEKPDKVTAIRKRLLAKRRARKRAQDTILDNAEDLAEKSPDASSGSLDSLSDDETDTQEDRPSEPSSALADGETDIKGVEASYKKLYTKRAQKMAAESNKKFVKRFARCMRIASTRMSLNYDDNPLKASAMDILTANDIDFSDGETFVPMDPVTAKELVELISSESHEDFTKHLMARTSDLMGRTDEYLKDVEGDLKNLAPVSVDIPRTASKKVAGNRKSAQLRRAAKDGNFDIPLNLESSPRRDPVSPLRDVIGNTRVGRRTARLKSLTGR